MPRLWKLSKLWKLSNVPTTQNLVELGRVT